MTKKVSFNIYLLLSSVLLFWIFFSSSFFYRSGLTILSNIPIVVFFAVSLLKKFLFKEKIFDSIFIISLLLAISVGLSELISKNYSITGFVFIVLLYSSFVFYFSLKKNAYNLLLLIPLFGLFLSEFLISIDVLKGALVTKYMNADGIGTMAVLSIMLSVSSFLKFFKKRKLLSFGSLLPMIPSLFLIFKANRVGAYFNLFVTLFLLLLYILLMKKKYLVLFLSLFFLVALLILFVLIPINNLQIMRMQISLAQLSKFDQILEPSVHERMFLLYRDFVYSMKFLFFGCGYMGFYRFNAIASHNVFGIAIQFGYAFLFVMLLLLIYCFKKLCNKTNYLSYFFCTIFLINFLFCFLYGMTFATKTTYIFLGAFLALSVKNKSCSLKNDYYYIEV